MFDGAVDVAQQDQRSVRTNVIKEGFGFVKEERQVVLNAGRGNAVFDVFVKPHFARIAFKRFSPARTEGRPSLPAHRKFMGREQTDFVNFFYRSLIVRIKDSDLVEFVIKKIQTIRLGRAHREEVKQSAATGKFAGCDHLRDMFIASRN